MLDLEQVFLIPAIITYYSLVVWDLQILRLTGYEVESTCGETFTIMQDYSLIQLLSCYGILVLPNLVIVK